MLQVTLPVFLMHQQQSAYMIAIIQHRISSRASPQSRPACRTYQIAEHPYLEGADIEGDARGQTRTSVFSWILSPRLFSALTGATRRALRTAGRRGANAVTLPRLARIVLVDIAILACFLFIYGLDGLLL